jgi:hypothetical protein
MNNALSQLGGKLSAYGANTYQPSFQANYSSPTSVNPTPSQMPFVQRANPALDKFKYIRRKLVIYSGDRELGSASESNFRIKLQKPIDEVVKVELRSFTLPTNIVNVPETACEFNFSFAYDPKKSSMSTLPKTAYIPVDLSGNVMAVDLSGTPLVPDISGNKTNIYNSGLITRVKLSLPVGTYTPTSLALAMAEQMDNHLVYLFGNPPTGWKWIEGVVNRNGNIELYSIDHSISFAIDTTGVQNPSSVATRIGSSTTTTTNPTPPTTLGNIIHFLGISNADFSVSSGGYYGDEAYHYLILPRQVGLITNNMICVVSEALGNNLVASKGRSDGFNCFALVPVNPTAVDIRVRWDNTLDADYFDVQKKAYNTLERIDIKITNIFGDVLDLRDQEVLMEFDIVQKISPDTYGV